MLPVTFQFLIAMIAYATNERMARKLDYVQEDLPRATCSVQP